GSQPLGRHGEQSPSRGSLNQTVAVLSKTDTNCQFRPGIVIRQPVPGSAGGDPPYEAILGAPRVGRKPWANRKDPCRDARRAQTHGSTGVAGNATGTGNAGARQTGGPRRVWLGMQECRRTEWHTHGSDIQGQSMRSSP